MKDKQCLQFQTKLEELASELSSVHGYDRLMSTIKSVSSWDDYMEIRAQIDITQWFKNKNLLKEIEPNLPRRAGYSDILLSFLEQDIYCEVTSPESLQKSIASENSNDAKKVQSLLRKQQWISKLEAEHEIRNTRITRNMLIKTNKQLPHSYPGILSLETGKSMIFTFDTRRIAQKLFPNRPQVMLLMLWSLERGSQIGEAPFCFINPNSPYQTIGKALLIHLGKDYKVIS